MTSQSESGYALANDPALDADPGQCPFCLHIEHLNDVCEVDLGEFGDCKCADSRSTTQAEPPGHQYGPGVPEFVEGMPRHIYLTAPVGFPDEGESCWFEWKEGNGYSRCRSSYRQHRNIGWF